MKNDHYVRLRVGHCDGRRREAASAQVKFGVAGPITGPSAATGAQMKNGVDQAAADINAAGGILGQKISVSYGDDASDPKQGVSVANKFAGRRREVRHRSLQFGVTIPSSEVYQENGMLQITPASTNPTFTERKLWNMFRVCGRDDQQGGVAGDYIAKTLQGQEHRHPSRQDHLRQRPRRRNQEGAQQGRHERKSCTRPIRRATRTSTRWFPRLKQRAIDVVYVGGYHRKPA